MSYIWTEPPSDASDVDEDYGIQSDDESVCVSFPFLSHRSNICFELQWLRVVYFIIYEP